MAQQIKYDEIIGNDDEYIVASSHVRRWCFQKFVTEVKRKDNINL